MIFSTLHFSKGTLHRRLCSNITNKLKIQKVVQSISRKIVCGQPALGSRHHYGSLQHSPDQYIAALWSRPIAHQRRYSVYGSEDKSHQKFEFVLQFLICTDWGHLEVESQSRDFFHTAQIRDEFPVSLRGTSYVVPKPLRGSKTRNGRFPYKISFAWRKSATKFLCAKTMSDKVVGHSFILVNDWRGTSSLTPKLGGYWPTPLQNADFKSIFDRNTSAVTPSKRVQLTLIGSPLRVFQWA